MNQETLDFYMQDGLSLFDLQNMTKIIREDMGDWFHAYLIRSLFILLGKADNNNERKLYTAFPGTCAAIKEWYNNPSLGLDKETTQ